MTSLIQSVKEAQFLKTNYIPTSAGYCHFYFYSNVFITAYLSVTFFSYILFDLLHYIFPLIHSFIST